MEVQTPMTTPDVSVVVPVYNTMPHLTRCMSSLVGQTIGHDRMRIIAVDDGSTDGSGRELDRFALRHPGLVTVVHQANSGGPAGPCNRGLELSTGRYVFFVGADDHLGRDALRRLVAAADRYGSDVVLGKVVGVHGRFLYQDIFAANQVDVGLADSPLPRSLANTKLFRRELLERYRIRYPEDLPIGSDLPFTLEACYRARRVSVLADYDYYFAVRRLDATNITYLSRHVQRLRAVEAMMEFTAGLIEPGKELDAMLVRHFDHDIARLLDDDLLRLDRATQVAVHEGVGRLARRHLTAEVTDRLAAETRVRTALARDGGLDDLLAAIRRDAEVGVPPTVVDGGRRYAAYPGFRDPTRGLPDACFDVTSAVDWPAKLDATGLAWETDENGDRVLTVTADSPVPDLTALGAAALTVRAEDVPADTRVSGGGQAGTTVRARFRVADLLTDAGPTGRRRTVSAQVGAFDPARAAELSGTAPLRAPRGAKAAPLVRRHGTRLYVITPVLDGSGRLMISVVPVTPGRIVAHARRLLRR
jgi:GT2 family glycosyltransferase